jgi:hypothetical protein
MRRNGKPQSVRHGLQTKFAKKAVNIAGYVISKGNFSTRCIVAIGADARLAAAE